MNNKTVHIVAFLLLAVGGLNWLLIGLLDINLVNMAVGSMPTLERAVYILVGLSAVYELLTHKAACRHCSHSTPSTEPVGE